MATVSTSRPSAITALGGATYDALVILGDWSIFAGRTLAWMLRRRPSRGTLLPIFYSVGVHSVTVIMITGTFIGMVLAVQSYGQFHQLGLATRLGAIINMSVVRELGPVLAATMLAGRIGSAMAAELATMRITEQVDALDSMGVNPIHYLVVPRFVACVLLIPLLTILADFMGVMGGALISTKVYRIEAHHYWTHAQESVGLWDLFSGLSKSTFFGAAIALISCHRGLNSRPGAEGVGRSATEAFVVSFIVILALDFFLALFMNSLYDRIWPAGGARLF
ncbi:MAG TPA: ABC transporter permease [Gemmataceae bacterium]|nr:ABC transporter permease [Gemmataceae bacterium]